MERDNFFISSLSNRNLRKTSRSFSFQFLILIFFRYTYLYIDRDRHCRRLQSRRLRRERLEAKLHSLEGDQEMVCQEIMVMQRQQLNDEDKLQRYRNQLQALREHQIEQQRQIQLVEFISK